MVDNGSTPRRYLDYAPLVIRSPQNVQVTGCLFLGSSNIVLATAKKWPKAPVSRSIDNMIITSNRWNTGNKGAPHTHAHTRAHTHIQPSVVLHLP